MCRLLNSTVNAYTSLVQVKTQPVCDRVKSMFRTLLKQGGKKLRCVRPQCELCTNVKQCAKYSITKNRQKMYKNTALVINGYFQSHNRYWFTFTLLNNNKN